MYVIAGVTGRVGSAAAQVLLDQGERVRVLVRDEARGAAWRARGAEVAVATLQDRAALARALAGARGLFTLLPEEPAVPDVRGHRRRMADAIAAAVTGAGVPHVVLLSATGAYLSEGAGPINELHYAEQVLRDSGTRLTALRAGYFQDNALAALAPARHDGIYPSLFPSADVAFPMVAARDVGRFAARCLVEPPARGEVVDALGPVSSVRDLAGALGRALGKELRIVDIPAAAHVDALTRAGIPAPFAEALAEMFSCFAAGRIAPRGDRAVFGTTTVDETLAHRMAA